MTKLTKPQRARLEKLAAYLEGLPEDYSHFNMAYWLLDASDADEVHYAMKNGGVASCGTAACAAGHGPAAGVLVPPRFIDRDAGGVDWTGYCTIFVGEEVRRRDWCFGGLWEDTDNHHWGAAARIRYLLANGQPPKDFNYADDDYLPLYAPYRVDQREAIDA